MAKENVSVVVFRAGPWSFGLDVSHVDRVLPACEIENLPDAPVYICGVVVIEGAVLPVVDPRNLVGEEEMGRPAIDSRFIIARPANTDLILIADSVDGVVDFPAKTITKRDRLGKGATLIRDLAAAPEGLIHIFDPTTLLSEKDAAAISAAIARRTQ